MRSRSEHALVGGAAVGGSAAGVALDPSASGPGDLVFGAVLLLGLLTLLRLALRAGARARRERHRSRHLALVPAEEVARRAVQQEQARLAADVEAVIRSGVLRMASGAEEALRAWERDPGPALRNVQDEGRRVTTELRRLLGLLREPAAGGPLAPAPAHRGALLPRSDGLVGAAVVALALVEWAAYAREVPGAPSSPLVLLSTAVAAGTTAGHRAAPWPAAAVCGAVFLAGAVVGAPPFPGLWTLVTLGALAWACTAREDPRRGPAAAALMGAGAVVPLSLQEPGNARILAVVVLGGAGAGLAVRAMDRSGRLARRSAAERAGHLERTAEAAVRARRLGVARDLHDLVSSAVGVVVVHAGAAEALRATDPARARASLDVVRRTTTETARELAQLTASADAAAVPGAVEHRLGDLAELVERMRGAGLAVTAALPGPEARLAPAPSAAVYRTVQEALTNAARHAPGSAVSVAVRVGPEEVCAEVVDDGPGRGPGARRGYGLTGISERVERLGGCLETGPGEGGTGFRVRVRLPVRAQDRVRT